MAEGFKLKLNNELLSDVGYTSDPNQVSLVKPNSFVANNNYLSNPIEGPINNNFSGSNWGGWNPSMGTIGTGSMIPDNFMTNIFGSGNFGPTVPGSFTGIGSLGDYNAGVLGPANDPNAVGTWGAGGKGWDSLGKGASAVASLGSLLMNWNNMKKQNKLMDEQIGLAKQGMEDQKQVYRNTVGDQDAARAARYKDPAYTSGRTI